MSSPNPKKPKQETTTDLTIPEPAKLMIPVSYPRLYNVKGASNEDSSGLGQKTNLQSRPVNVNY